MAAFKTYEEITAWQEDRTPATGIYSVSKRGMSARDFGLRERMRRAAVSVCSNIAEACGRRGNSGFMEFLRIAKDSVVEVASQLNHALDLGCMTGGMHASFQCETKKMALMLHRLNASIAIQVGSASLHNDFA